MDELSRGVVDEDEEAEAFPADRSYWEEKASKAMLVVVDDMLEITKQFDPKLELKCTSSEHFGQLAWQFKRVSGSSGLKVQAAIAC
jgi:hypothetical protein